MKSYTAMLKEELAHVGVHKNCCRRAELSALIKTCGQLSLVGYQKFALVIETEYESIASRIISLCKQLYSYQPEILRFDRNQPRIMTVFQLNFESGATTEKILTDLEMLKIQNGEPALVNSDMLLPSSGLENKCCIGSALRGAFLGCGVLVNPYKQYQLEFLFFNELIADKMTELLAFLGISCGWIPRGQREVIYVKEIDSIITLMGLMGAHKMLLELENIRVLKEVRNNINRRNNFDTANISKTVNASVKQAEAVRLIMQNNEFNSLSEPLQQMAELRLNYPDSTLAQLAQMAGISKSAANNRLRRIVEIAEKYR